MKHAAFISLAVLMLAACHEESTEPETAGPITPPQPAIVTGYEFQITTNNAASRPPDVDGTRIVWMDRRNGFPELYMCERVGKSCVENLIAKHPAVPESPVISGTRIVWADRRGGQGHRDIYACEWSGSDCPEMLIATGGSNPDIDGQRIVWQDYPGGSQYEHHIYTCSWDTGNCPALQVTANLAPRVNPVVSGDRIVWSEIHTGSWDIYLCEWNGSSCSETWLTTGPDYDGEPAISGDRIVWERRPSGSAAGYIYMSEWDGVSWPQVMIETATEIENPAIDGNRIVWDGDRLGLCEWNGTSCLTVTIAETEGRETNPAISGNRIVWGDYWSGSTGREIHLFEIGGVFAEADLMIEKDYWPAWPERYTGDIITFDLTVVNQGPDAAPNVQVVDYPPLGLEFLPYPSSSPGCQKSGAQIECLLDDMAPDATLVKYLAFEILEGPIGEFLNQTTVSSSAIDGNEADNLSAAILEVVAREQLPSEMIVDLDLSGGQSGTVTIETTITGTPGTSDGKFQIQFLGETVQITLGNGATCSVASPCTISFTFMDDHLPPGTGPYNLGSGGWEPRIVILHDPEEDGTFDELTTTVYDGAPEPYTLEAQITSTSHLGLGVLLKKVDSDIKPGSSPNCVKDKSKGRLPVAIKSESEIDLAEVDPSTVEIDDDMNPFTAGVPWVRWSLNKDVSGDSKPDLVLHFSPEDLLDHGLLVHANTLYITGELNDGSLILGSDVIYLAGETPCLD